MTQIINRNAPIIILLIIGKWFQQREVISEQTVRELKKIVVNLSLPAVLFISFLTIDLEPKYFWFLPLIFGGCLLLYF